MAVPVTRPRTGLAGSRSCCLHSPIVAPDYQSWARLRVANGETHRSDAPCPMLSRNTRERRTFQMLGPGPLHIRAIETVPLRARLPRVFRGSKYQMDTRC